MMVDGTHGASRFGEEEPREIASARAAADSSTAPCILSICATVASMAFTFALAFAIQLLSSYGTPPSAQPSRRASSPPRFSGFSSS